MKSNLKDLESQFQNYLFHSDPEIAKHIVSTNKVPAEVRLDIYGNAYRSRLTEALTASYPIIEAYLGTHDFEELCYAYIAAQPSEYRSIRWFGDKMSDFLSLETPYSNHPFLAELATLEWTMAIVFDAADAPVLQIEEMANVAPEAWVDMRLQAHPAIQRLALKWNVVQIWQAITDENAPPEPMQSEKKIEWVLWRQDLLSHFASLSPDEAWAIDAMLKDKTFSEICEGLCEWNAEEETGMRAASLLKGWIEAGLISGIR